MTKTHINYIIIGGELADVDNLFFIGSKINTEGDTLVREINRLTMGRYAMACLGTIWKDRDI